MHTVVGTFKLDTTSSSPLYCRFTHSSHQTMDLRGIARLTLTALVRHRRISRRVLVVSVATQYVASVDICDTENIPFSLQTEIVYNILSIIEILKGLRIVSVGEDDVLLCNRVGGHIANAFHA